MLLLAGEQCLYTVHGGIGNERGGGWAALIVVLQKQLAQLLMLHVVDHQPKAAANKEEVGQWRYTQLNLAQVAALQ